MFFMEMYKILSEDKIPVRGLSGLDIRDFWPSEIDETVDTHISVRFINTEIYETLRAMLGKNDKYCYLKTLNKISKCRIEHLKISRNYERYGNDVIPRSKEYFALFEIIK